MPAPRYAICFTPPPVSPLALFGAGVIGYDCFQRTEVPHRSIDGIDPSVLALATVEPRRYGFHATLLAPFGLAADTNEAELTKAFLEFAEAPFPVAVGLLHVTAMDRFVVISPVEHHPAIEALADACVMAFDQCRAPVTNAGRARCDEFRFYMALAGPIPDNVRRAFKGSLSKAFSDLSRDHLELGAVSLMRQDDQAGRFYVLARQRLSGRA